MTLFGQNNSEIDDILTNSLTNQTNEVNLNDQILRYLEFLREEARLHREYTQWYYSMILTLLSALSIIISAILVWLNWKSKKDIKTQVNQQFKERGENIINEKIKQFDLLINEKGENIINDIKTQNEKIRQFDLLINENKQKATKQFEEINKILLELSAFSNRIGKQKNREEQQINVNDLRGKNILWVDDYPENNDYPMEMLKQVGIKFSLAKETEDALDILRKKKFDLIISDMGRGDNPSAGLDLLKELKNIGINTPVIIFSSSQAIKKYGHNALELGAIELTTGFANLLNIVQKELLMK
jgi:CheY-like chemotaxis protein